MGDALMTKKKTDRKDKPEVTPTMKPGKAPKELSKETQEKSPEGAPPQPTHTPTHLIKMHQLEGEARSQAEAMAAKVRAQFANKDIWGTTMKNLRDFANSDPLRLTAHEEAELNKRDSITGHSRVGSTDSGGTVPDTEPLLPFARKDSTSTEQAAHTELSPYITQEDSNSESPLSTEQVASDTERSPSIISTVKPEQDTDLRSHLEDTSDRDMLRETFGPLITPREALRDVLSRYTPAVRSPMGNAFSGDGYWASSFGQSSSSMVSPSTYSPLASSREDFCPAQPSVAQPSPGPNPPQSYEPLALVDPDMKATYTRVRDDIDICARRLLEVTTGRTQPPICDSMFEACAKHVDPIFLVTAAELVLNERETELQPGMIDPDLPTTLSRFAPEESEILHHFSVKEEPHWDNKDGWLRMDDCEMETILEANREALRGLREKKQPENKDRDEKMLVVIWATKLLEECEEIAANSQYVDENDEGITYAHILRSIREEATAMMERIKDRREMEAEIAAGTFRLSQYEESEEDITGSEDTTDGTNVTPTPFRRLRSPSLTSEDKESRHKGPTLEELNAWADQLEKLEVGDASDALTSSLSQETSNVSSNNPFLRRLSARHSKLGSSKKRDSVPLGLASTKDLFHRRLISSSPQSRMSMPVATSPAKHSQEEVTPVHRRLFGVSTPQIPKSTTTTDGAANFGQIQPFHRRLLSQGSPQKRFSMPITGASPNKETGQSLHRRLLSQFSPKKQANDSNSSGEPTQPFHRRLLNQSSPLRHSMSSTSFSGIRRSIVGAPPRFRSMNMFGASRETPGEPNETVDAPRETVVVPRETVGLSNTTTGEEEDWVSELQRMERKEQERRDNDQENKGGSE